MYTVERNNGMIHSFNTEIAAKYGVNAAVIFNHISYWLEKNAANNTNYYDGEYWTYSSIKGFKQIFHYMSENQIRTALKKLTDNDVLKTGNYNKLAYDRTLWYAFGKIGKSIWEKSQMEIEKITNGNYENHKPIPDNITNNITDRRTDNKENIQKKAQCKEIIDKFNSVCVSFNKVSKLTDAREKTIKARLKEYSMQDIITVFEKAEKSDFLKGKNGTFKASFDWLMKPANFIKVLEGNYDNRSDGNEQYFTNLKPVDTYKSTVL